MGETLTFDDVDKEFFGGGREEGGFLTLTTSDPLKSVSLASTSSEPFTSDS